MQKQLLVKGYNIREYFYSFILYSEIITMTRYGLAEAITSKVIYTNLNSIRECNCNQLKSDNTLYLYKYNKLLYIMKY